MPKREKIGKDVLGKKGKMTAKESKKFEEWRAKREAEKRKKSKEEAEEIEGKKVEAKAPVEKQPTDEQLARERAKEMEEMAKLKEEKPVRVKEHRRHLPEEAKPKTGEDEGIEEFELLRRRAEESMEEEEEELPSLLKPKKKVK